MRTFQILSVLAAFVLAGCSRSDSQTSNDHLFLSPNVTAPGASSLKEGGTAYVRIKEYSAPRMKDVVPAGVECTFQFGSAVKLIERKEGPPVLWLVATEKSRAWIPAYILTGSQAELDFLRDKNRIPQSMSFICEKVINGSTKRIACGRTHIPGLFAVDSDDGMPTPAYEDGTSPYAIKGNAVVFDATVISAKWVNAARKQVGPPVFNAAKQVFQPATSCLYYCVSDGDKPAFECIDVVALKVRK